MLLTSEVTNEMHAHVCVWTGLQLHTNRRDLVNQHTILSRGPVRMSLDKTYDGYIQSGNCPIKKPRPQYVVYVYLESVLDHMHIPAIIFKMKTSLSKAISM